ncbi:MAG: hypothetical protein RLY14_2622 [Planctomycetota bacterium]|jgi:hypothetical protein
MLAINLFFLGEAQFFNRYLHPLSWSGVKARFVFPHFV